MCYLNRFSGPWWQQTARAMVWFSTCLTVGAIAPTGAEIDGAADPSAAAVPSWARDFHTLVSYSTTREGREWELGMMAERGGWTTGWYGAWWVQQNVQRLGKYDALRHVERLRKAGVRNVFYFDAGEYGEFVALVHEGNLVRSQWELRLYRDEPGELMWFGAEAFYRDPNPLKLKNYRDFGLPAWTMPDGAPVRSVYDLSHTSFEGKLQPWEYSKVAVSPEIAQKLKLAAFLSRGPDPAPPEAGLGRIRSYDHSNPYLLQDFEAGVGQMLTQRPAFLHFDNYFDNEIIYPYNQAFGPWSLANFRTMLKGRLDARSLRQLGIADVDLFDLKQYVLSRPYGDPARRPFFRDARWHDDPIWNAFVCSKLADSQRLFRELYAFCKRESRRQGEEVVVVGNVIPIFPGGSMCLGALDMAHFEHHLAKQFGPLVIPTGLPPLGRVGGLTRLGAAISNAGYCWMSGYVPKDLSGPGHENLHRVLAFDCLANRGVLDYNYQYRDGYSPGSDQSAAWVNCFIKSFSHHYGSRTPLSDVALVYPGQTLLASVDVFSMGPGPCLYDYLGWAQALTELHAAWDTVTDEQLAPAALAKYRLVVLPSCACLSDAQLAALVAHVRSGGRVVISGTAGTRFGVERFLWKRPEGQSLAARLKAETDARRVTVAEQPFGRVFYEDIAKSRRQRGRDEMRALVDGALVGAAPVVTTSASALVGLFPYRAANGHLSIDLVNYDLDVAGDRLTPAAGVELVVRVPAGARVAAGPVTMISPELRTPADAAASPRPLTPWVYGRRDLEVGPRADGALVVRVPPFLAFVTLDVPLEPGPDR